MPMILLFVPSMSYAPFLQFFLSTFTSMFRLINVPFHCNLTFLSMSNPLFQFIFASYVRILHPVFFLNPLTPISDQDIISPYNINTESSRQVRRIKKKTQLGNYGLIQYQILQIEIISILWQTVGRNTMRSWELKG